MAEINTSEKGGGRGTRSSKKSTRVDMTPMVDLGFLLITFFMLTTTMAQPKTMDLVMPKDGPPMPLPDKKALTIVLGPDNKIAWYEGIGTDPAMPPQIHYTSYANHAGIRDVIIDKKNTVQQAFQKNELMVLIKADRHSNYKNVVDIMDEMLINQVDRYAVVDITPAEEQYFR
ncbi:MAG: biopolymer transporter ExbD [Chitinophaga sp.]|uniref:ExbD/TolR family protein n=1 Tax=Chitinophaga sp. TaxID=1869181 RepID=UPI001B1FDB0C|nr:biopolymer transporter ExbD [Chitinophaga sp.]MBO9731822.1 biopolymer transporter ExbD [Chitinophaga sp.]